MEKIAALLQRISMKEIKNGLNIVHHLISVINVEFHHFPHSPCSKFCIRTYLGKFKS